MASSTTNPRASKRENSDKKLRLIPRAYMMAKDERKVRGMEREAAVAWRNPKNMSRIRNTRPMVVAKLFWSSEKDLSTSSA